MAINRLRFHRNRAYAHVFRSGSGRDKRGACRVWGLGFGIEGQARAGTREVRLTCRDMSQHIVTGICVIFDLHSLCDTVHVTNLQWLGTDDVPRQCRMWWENLAGGPEGRSKQRLGSMEGGRNSRNSPCGEPLEACTTSKAIPGPCASRN